MVVLTKLFPVWDDKQDINLNERSEIMDTSVFLLINGFAVPDTFLSQSILAATQGQTPRM